MRSDVLVGMLGGRRPPTPEEYPPTGEDYPPREEMGGGWLYQVHDLTLKTLRARERAVRNTLPHGMCGGLGAVSVSVYI